MLHNPDMKFLVEPEGPKLTMVLPARELGMVLTACQKHCSPAQFKQLTFKRVLLLMMASPGKHTGTDVPHQVAYCQFKQRVLKSCHTSVLSSFTRTRNPLFRKVYIYPFIKFMMEYLGLRRGRCLLFFPSRIKT